MSEIKTTENLMVNTYYDIPKITIWGDKGDHEVVPKLSFTFRDGNPSFVVYTGEMGSMLNFGMDYLTLGSVLEAMSLVANAENGSRISIDRTGFKYQNGEKTNEKTVYAVFHIGKSNEGIVYLSIISEGKPQIVFPFKKTEWHNYRDETKEFIQPALESKLIAVGYIRTLQTLSAAMLAQYTKESYIEGDWKPGVIDSKYNNGSGKKHNGNKNARQSAVKSAVKSGDFEESTHTSFDADIPY